MSTLQVLPGVSKFFIKSPGLQVRAPNLPGKSAAHKTSESLILFYGEMSGKFGKPSGDSRRAFRHCRKTHREHSESLRVILREYSYIVVKRILTTRGFWDVSRFWKSGGWQVWLRLFHSCYFLGYYPSTIQESYWVTLKWLKLAKFNLLYSITRYCSEFASINIPTLDFKGSF